jgi:serine/threonine protein kinase
MDFTPENIAKLGSLLRKMLRFVPSTRRSALDILTDDWFRDIQLISKGE